MYFHIKEKSHKYIIWAASSEKGAYGNLKKIVRYISAFDYYESIYWFCANTFENKMLQYFTETS